MHTHDLTNGHNLSLSLCSYSCSLGAESVTLNQTCAVNMADTHTEDTLKKGLHANESLSVFSTMAPINKSL